MSLSGETRLLEDFKSFFLGKDLMKKTNVLLLWEPSTSSLTVTILKDGSFSSVVRGHAEDAYLAAASTSPAPSHPALAGRRGFQSQKRLLLPRAVRGLAG